MTAPQALPESLQRAFAPTPRGVAGLVDQLLTACVGDVQFERAGDRCVCRWQENGDCREATIPLPPAAFRTVLARVAALCQERGLDSATPYGGAGDLAIGDDPLTAVYIAFTNTPDRQQLTVRRTGENGTRGVEMQAHVEPAWAKSLATPSPV